MFVGSKRVSPRERGLASARRIRQTLPAKYESTDEPDQSALFEIEASDEDACVWLVAGKGEDAVAVNLGPREAVATKLGLAG